MGCRKFDRTARLLKLEHMLYQNKDGFSIKELIEKCDTSRRTIYRDLAALQSELNIPIWQNGRKFGIMEGFYMPPIRFSNLEAFYVFQASRLMYKYTHKYDKNIVSILIKLNSIVSDPFRKHITQTIELMQKQPRDEKLINNIARLSQAWQSGLQVIIEHRMPKAQNAEKITVDPYFIEPSADRHASWLIGYCPSTTSMRNFKISRIENVTITDIKITPNDGFNGAVYLSNYWHIPHVSKNVNKPTTVKLKFNSVAGRIIEEAIWHPTQILNHQDDGCVIMTLKILETKQIQDWILQWGNDVEVLKPKALRKMIINTIKSMARIYEKNS